MTAARRLAAILAADVVCYSWSNGRGRRGRSASGGAGHPMTLNANYRFPPTATSSSMIRNVRST